MRPSSEHAANQRLIAATSHTSIDQSFPVAERSVPTRTRPDSWARAVMML
jgi:hypothetical protein